MEEIENECSNHQSKKIPKKGIIYLSTIPPYMNVTRIREVFGEFGNVGRVFLQLNNRDKTDKKSKKRKVAKKFSEGWVEFERKSIAKKVASMLNNTQISTRKKSKHFDCIWNIKYLSNFKWTHLHERLAYEKAARNKKLKAEIELAKKKANVFSSNLDKRRKSKDIIVNKEFEDISNISRKPNSEKDEMSTENRSEFLQSLFT